MRSAAIAPGAFLVTRPDQRRAIASPLRLEILEHLVFAAPAAIAEIARRMARPPASLYYHFRLLAEAGLIIPSGTRKSGKRDETLYRPVADRIALASSPHSPAATQASVQTAKAIFRLAGREMQAALRCKDLCTSGRRRSFYVRRLPAHLDARGLAQVNRHIEAIEMIVSRAFTKQPNNRRDAQPCAITIALLPMGRHRQ